MCLYDTQISSQALTLKRLLDGERVREKMPEEISDMICNFIFSVLGIQDFFISDVRINNVVMLERMMESKKQFRTLFKKSWI